MLHTPLFVHDLLLLLLLLNPIREVDLLPCFYVFRGTITSPPPLLSTLRHSHIPRFIPISFKFLRASTCSTRSYIMASPCALPPLHLHPPLSCFQSYALPHNLDSLPPNLNDSYALSRCPQHALFKFKSLLRYLALPLTVKR